MLRNLELALQADMLPVERARARVSAAIGDPLSLEEGRTFEIDLASATFTSARDGRPSFRGTCQVIACTSRQDTWRWGFDEPDVPKSATRDIRALVRNDPVLFEPSLASPVDVPDAAFALRLATWIALRGGVTGAVLASILGRPAYLALDIVAVGDASPQWCFSCGAPGPFVTRDAVSLCRSCASALRALGEPHPFDPRRVVFQGTLLTPSDIVTLRAAFDSAPNLALTAPGTDETHGDVARAICLCCGLVRGDVLVLNEAFTVCPVCAEACVNALS